jgi:hypothetical protein
MMRSRQLIYRAALAAAFVLVVGLGGGAGTASAAKVTTTLVWPQAWASRIVTPRGGTVVTNGTVRVTAQLAPGVRSFRAWVGNARVRSAYRASGRLRDATLRVGRTPGLGYGRRILYVETLGRRGQEWWAESHIVLARPGKGLFSEVAAHRVPGAGADVKVTTASASDRVSLRIDNGRRRSVPGPGGRHSLHLNADAGLHPGPNVVSVRALDAADGRYQVRRVTINMPASLPVAGAGAARRAHAREAVRFSATATKSPRGMRPRYHWVIVTRPAGSRARLRRATSAHPVLRPDRIGRYVLRLTVSARRGARVGGRPTDSATTTLAATPPAGAIGVPVDTIEDQGVTIGADHYPAPDRDDALQMLVLSRSTLAKVSNDSYTNDDAGATRLLSAVKSLPNTDLVIVAKPTARTNNASDVTANTTINKALAQIGVQPASQAVTNGATQCFQSEPCSVFSAIGVPGIPVGQGDLNDGLASLRSRAWGDLHGYLQENLQNSGFTFVSTERVPFDTGPSGADPAVVTIGSNETGSPYGVQTYTSQTIAAGSSGFYVLILSTGDLTMLAQSTYTDDAEGLATMHTLLSSYAGKRTALVIVRSIGAVSRVNAAGWDGVASDLEKLGASGSYFDQLNGSTSDAWAQVSPGGDPAASSYPDPDAQFASAEHNGGGRLTGLLADDALSQFYPDESIPSGLKDPARPLAATLAGLISLPSTGWPEDRYTTGEQNVESCIAAHVDPNGGLPMPIQSDYGNANDAGNWAGYDATIKASGYYATLSSYTDCGSFTQSDFSTVVAQLDKEWSALPRVYNLFANIKAVVDSTKAPSQIASIAAAVNSSVAGNDSRPARLDALGISSDALWALSTIPGFSTESNAINFLAGALGIASELHQNSDGSSGSVTSTTAANFAASLSTQLTLDSQALDQEREILLEDWTKLQIATQNAGNLTNAAANWQWTPDEARSAADALGMSVRRESYLALVPTAYSLYRLRPGTGSLPQTPASYQCSTLYNGVFVVWNPFSAVQPLGSVRLPTNASGALEDWTFGQPNTAALTTVNKQVGMASAPLLAGLFGDPSPNDPYQPLNTPLFNQTEFAIEAYANATQNTITVTHASAGGGNRTTNSICKAATS